jgi:hypothetical protein
MVAARRPKTFVAAMRRFVDGRMLGKVPFRSKETVGKTSRKQTLAPDLSTSGRNARMDGCKKGSSFTNFCRA